MKNRILVVIAGLIASTFISLVNSKPLDIKLFAKTAEYTSVKLSPNGQFLAATAPNGNQTVLAIIQRDTMKLKFVVRLREREHVDEYYWANNERIIFTKVEQTGLLEQKTSYGEIFATNVDGSKQSYLYGYDADSRLADIRIGRHQGSERAHGDIVHMLPDDPEHIIISARTWGNSFDTPVKLYRLNIYTGKRRVITRTPFGNMRYLLSKKGEPVMAFGRDLNGIKRSFFFAENRKWQEVSEDSPIFGLVPIQTNESKNHMLFTGNPNEGTDALFKYDFSNNKLTKIYQNESSDILTYIREPISNEIVGVELMPNKIEYHYIKPEHEFAKLHQGLVSAFAGHAIRITSQTNNLDELIIYAGSDKNPGDFYLFDQKKKNASYLLSVKRWLDPAIMADRKPIEFKNRSGDSIHGYLTLPTEAKKRAPLVVLVHGGPYGERDSWWFDTDAQFLANNGYAVLQVNYRGSSGYGESFETVAYQKRATMIQEDIIDGTRWALSQKTIDNEKVCIMGWSFGGYSAVMAPLVEPELFKCAIAAAGVYDAVEQEEEADYSNTQSVAAIAATVYGNDEKLLKSESPITYIDKLKTPIFIVHGGKDKRVPPEQAEILKEALDKRKIPYEWMFKKKEGHGFFNEKNRVEFYQRTLNFLSTYLN